METHINEPSGWDGLPDEILLQILSYLTPHSITRLQQASRRLQKLCLDDELWKQHCFEESTWYMALLHRRDARVVDTAFLTETNEETTSSDDVTDSRGSRYRRIQDMANWDPTFPSERISWYDEYIQRNGPVSISWFETPRNEEGGQNIDVEARGLALFGPGGRETEHGEMLAVSPLDDGSVCLWDVRGTRGKQGGIVGRSSPDILFIDGPGSGNTRRSKKIDTGVTDCVSVDHAGHKAFFAVQSHLIEVDLNRLEVIDRESFEWSITALSPVHAGVPITVGTSLGIHLHDFRQRSKLREAAVDRLEENPYRVIFDSKPLPPYASLSQPTPVSVLHLPAPGSATSVTDDIYVSGRFTSILHYDRRKFPSIVNSIHSGAMINTLAALPYPFSTVESEVRRQGEFTVERANELRHAREGQTLIAGGAYNSKGSLEVYGINPVEDFDGTRSVHNSVLHNRQTAASSSILSVTTHGAKIVFSDGSGLIKWFERDGITECRRIRIGHTDSQETSSLFASMPASGDLARKIISTKPVADSRAPGPSSSAASSAPSTDSPPVTTVPDERPNNDNIMFWTGEKVGMVSFTTSPLCTASDFKGPFDEEADAEEEARAAYSNQLREALGRQADEVSLVSRLGYGP